MLNGYSQQLLPRGGVAILTLLGVSVFALAVMSTVANLTQAQGRIASAEIATQKTFYTAEAGLNQTLYSLAQNPAATISSAPTTVNGFTTTVTVTPDPGFPTASPPGFQGYVTVQTSDSSGKIRTLKIKATTSTLGGTFIYGAQTDIGGVTMSSSDSTINGDVYSNGDVSGSGTINGNATVADNSVLDQGNGNRVAATDEFTFGQSAATAKLAQQFTAGTTGTLNHLAVLLRAQGSPNPTTLAWQIKTDSPGTPATTLASGLFRSVDAHSTLTWVYAHLPTPVSVTAATKYWLVIDPVVNATNYWAWGKDTGSTYVSGSPVSWNSTTSTWSAVAADFNFKTWLGTTYTSLSDVKVSGNAAADNISASKVCGDASYFTITKTAQDFLNAPTGCTPTTPGIGSVSESLPQRKALPITASDITKWQTQVQTACGTGCIGSSYSASTNLSVTVSAATGGSIPANTTYYYRVATVAGSVETVVSSEASGSTPNNGSKKTLTVTWNKIGTSYHLYRTATAGAYSSSSLVNNPIINCGSGTCTFNDDGSYSLTTGTTTCPNTCLGWQKISGDLTIDGALTLTGNVWVTGNITVSNNMTAKIDSSLSTMSLFLIAGDMSVPTSGKVNSGNGAGLCGSDCSATNPTNFLLVVSTNVDTGSNCSYSSGSPSIDAPNNSTGVIFAAPFGAIHVKKAAINASASRSLCLETQTLVNFVSSISSLFIPSPTIQPIASVPNTWGEQ